MSLLRSFVSHILPVRCKKIFRTIYIKILRMTKKDLNYFYNDNFATTLLRNKIWIKDFCNLIIKTCNPKSVIDFGCGTGDILRPFEKKGITILGIDGSKSNKKHSKIKENNFLLFDLRNRYRDKRKYDLCICFEVGEHIEKKYSNMLIENLTQSSSTILFTASPNPDGIDHINVYPYEWWINKFRKYDFELDTGLTNTLKEEMRKIPGIQEWYVKNLLIFRKM